jgi:hypothetical protein
MLGAVTDEEEGDKFSTANVNFLNTKWWKFQ